MKVVGFMSRHCKVPRNLEVKELETGIRWRFAKANKLQISEIPSPSITSPRLIQDYIVFIH